MLCEEVCALWDLEFCTPAQGALASELPALGVPASESPCFGGPASEPLLWGAHILLKPRPSTRTAGQGPSTCYQVPKLCWRVGTGSKTVMTECDCLGRAPSSDGLGQAESRRRPPAAVSPHRPRPHRSCIPEAWPSPYRQPPSAKVWTSLLPTPTGSWAAGGHLRLPALRSGPRPSALPRKPCA